MPEALFENSRPSDLRHENIHGLAEILQSAQRLTDAIISAQADSKQLISDAQAISTEGVASFQEAGANLKAISVDSQEMISEAINTKGGELIAILTEAIGAIRKNGADLNRVSSQAIMGPVTELSKATEQLLQAAAEAEMNRVAASDARMKLIDYRRDLDAYEAVVLKRCKEAAAKAIAGLSFLGRLWAVFVPPLAAVNIPKAPARPTTKTTK